MDPSAHEEHRRYVVGMYGGHGVRAECRVRHFVERVEHVSAGWRGAVELSVTT